MASKLDLKYLGAQFLIYEYKKCLLKIDFYEEKIQSLIDDGKKKDSKRYTAPLKLFQKYKSDIEAEAVRRNMPLEDLEGIRE